MTNITAAMVKELRETTSAGMLDCKKALTETNGDMEQAIDWLRKKGLASAAKKASRIAAEGLVAVAVDGNKGAVVEVNSETDFVAKNEIFQEYVEDAAQVALMYKGEVCDMKTFQCPKVHKSFEERLTDMIAKIGENMNIRRFERFESTGLVEKYIHGDGKIAVLVDFAKGDKAIAKDVCMQIAAAKPEYLKREDVPAERVEKEMEILKAQAMNEGKPAEIAEKMVQGRFGKFYGEICLVEQDFVKDSDKKVSKVLEENNAEIVRFARFEKGEGIEKKEENFAEEVANQLK